MISYSAQSLFLGQLISVRGIKQCRVMTTVQLIIYWVKEPHLKIPNFQIIIYWRWQLGNGK